MTYKREINERIQYIKNRFLEMNIELPTEEVILASLKCFIDHIDSPIKGEIEEIWKIDEEEH